MGRAPRKTTHRKVPVTFIPGGTVDAAEGDTILNAAWRGGIPVDAPCGGQGICGRCRVRVRGAPPPAEAEVRFFSAAELAEGWRLSCRTPAANEIEVQLERASDSVPALTFLPSLRRSPMAKSGLGAAVDLGTTTLAAQLWDLASGQLVGTATAPNPQRRYGADVISRISSAAENKALPELRDGLLRGLSSLFRTCLRTGRTSHSVIKAVVISGNTVMQHFFLGADPSSLARAPFKPVFLEHPPFKGKEAGLAAAGNAVVRMVPCVSAFIGGDAVAGTAVLMEKSADRPALLIDMGTNAEVVLIRKRSIVATSAAAGPALEGGNISSGLSAGPGAVERVDFNGDLSLRVIGGREPRGICGSGLLDLAALLLRFGLLLPDGRLVSSGEAAAGPWRTLGTRLHDSDGMNSFSLVRPGKRRPGVTVTQEDIRQLQLARSAIVTAWKHLLCTSRTSPSAISRVFLAGGYGYSIRPETLTRTGLLHPSWGGRLLLVGNASLAGAAQMLLDEPLFERAEEVASTVRALQLAESPSFQKDFLGNLPFPEA